MNVNSNIINNSHTGNNPNIYELMKWNIPLDFPFGMNLEFSKTCDSHTMEYYSAI